MILIVRFSLSHYFILIASFSLAGFVGDLRTSGVGQRPAASREEPWRARLTVPVQLRRELDDLDLQRLAEGRPVHCAQRLQSGTHSLQQNVAFHL